MKQCQKCHKENRDKALYCRFCGTELETESEAITGEAEFTGETEMFDDVNDALSVLTGLEQQKEMLREHVATMKAIIKQRGRSALGSINSNILITGPSGSGKTTLTFQLGTLMKKAGIFKEDECEPYNTLTIDNLNLEENPLVAVQLEDAHKFLPDNKENDLTGSPLEYLTVQSRLSLTVGESPLILIINGNQELKEYIDRRPELKSLFALEIVLPDYTPTEVTNICCQILKEKYNLSITPEAREKLCRVFNYERRNSERFGNAHLAEAKASELMMAATRRAKGKKVTKVVEEDVTGKEFVPKSIDEVMAEFDKYVGVDEIKKTMMEIVNSILSFEKLHPGEPFVLKDHYIFTGNPGTGKTTIARVFADALSAMGVLPSGQLVEVAPGELKGMYQGHTAPKVDAVYDRAMGGVLFIDEAYGIWSGENDDFGTEAVTALIKNAEDRRGKLVAILAGYEKEMGIFSTANPGIASRFNVTIKFRDYKGPELAEIARRMVKSQGYTLDESAETGIVKFFEKMYLSRKKDFANARDVRNAVDKAIKAQNTRIRQESSQPGFNPATEFMLTMGDFTGENEKPPMTVDEVIATLDDLIGMDEIKQEIRKMANVALVNRMRMERGLGTAALQPINIILTGNPGTGKTTIAKRLGQVLHAAGVLSSDKVVEREAKTILSSYVNASGQNMDKAVDEAMGGVLFIDEAYNLLPQPGSMNNTGNEALDALMTRMENDKGKFVVVIAGYKDRMEELIRRGNPGLMSRFNKSFHIEDYDADALTKIFKINLSKRKFTMTTEAEHALAWRMQEMVANKGLHFGNAREAVNLLNEVVELQGNRIAADTSIIDTNPDALTTIEAADIPMN